eukprot:INCI15078.1.p1 GENE.INCI15078.1~~INCI15078.1.p1  ORF type:complete len:192 (-),score=30.75 INCI15078.1:103-678(-)
MPSPISPLDSLAILAVTLVSGVVSELVSWYLVYRTQAFKDLKSKIERESRKLDKIKEKHEVDPKKKAKKKKEEDRIVKDLTVAQQKLSGLNIRSTLLMAATMIGLFWGLNSYYSGIVVAKLPFEPISIVRSLAHRNLSGDDVTDCGVAFLYAVASMGIKANVKKLIGGEAPKVSEHVPSLWNQAEAAVGQQ